MRASGDEETLAEFEAWLYTPPVGSDESSEDVERMLREREMGMFKQAARQQGGL